MPKSINKLIMSKFLNLINEVTPSTDGISGGDGIPTGSGISNSTSTATKGKGGSFAQKLVSGAKGAMEPVKKIDDVTHGRYDPIGGLQKFLDRLLDMSTTKLGSFGKKDYNRVRLEDDIVTNINSYQSTETPEDASIAAESYCFIKKLHEATASMERGKDGRFKPTGEVSLAKQVYDVLKSIYPEMLLKVDVPGTKRKQADRRISMITKGVFDFLKKIKEFYPDIPFTFTVSDKKSGTSNTNVAESAETVDYNKIDKDVWIKSIGKDNAEKIVRGLVDIYPEYNIKFEKDSTDTSTESDSVATESIIKDAVFELIAPTGFGQQGVQYTLKPQSAETAKVLNDKKIKFLTYLNKTPQNIFKTSENNNGTIYAYDNNNEVINNLTSNARFQWNGQEKLYIIGSNIKEIVGHKFSEGAFPIDKKMGKLSSDNKKVIFYLDPRQPNNLLSATLIRDLPTQKQWQINSKTIKPATKEEITFFNAKPVP
jgi:hypothetical protein